MTNEDKARVDAIVAEHLGVDPEKVTGGANLLDDLGGDSLDIVELVMAFEEAFSVDISDEQTERMVLVDDCYREIDAALAGKGKRAS